MMATDKSKKRARVRVRVQVRAGTYVQGVTNVGVTDEAEREP